MPLIVYSPDPDHDFVQRLGYPIASNIRELAPYNDKKRVVVRWGNSRLGIDLNTNQEIEFPNVINPSFAIRNNCQKHRAIALMGEAVTTPRLYEGRVPARHLAVIRPKQHQCGQGFRVKKGPFSVARGYYATQFIQTNTEYRVWFCGNRTLCAKRVPMDDDWEVENAKYPCRSEWGYEFRDTPLTLHNRTLKAAAKIGLDVGAADVVCQKGRFYWLELNSEPSVDHRRIKLFFRHGLYDLVRRKFPKVAIALPQD